MSTKVTIEHVLLLAPNVRSSYREAFENAQAVLDRYQISQSALRVAHFMAQVLHESGGLTIQFENLNYSPERLPKVWPSRFRPRGPLDANDFAYNPQRLANEVYGGRMGNSGANDGHNYRGRGLMQLTGKDSYREATRILRASDPAAPDFVATPDAVVDAPWCLAIAAAEWASKGCNAFADADDLNKITRAINGGLIGLPERAEWAKRTKAIWAEARGISLDEMLFDVPRPSRKKAKPKAAKPARAKPASKKPAAKNAASKKKAPAAKPKKARTRRA